MFKVHKQDEKRRALEDRPENFNKTDDPEAVTANGKDKVIKEAVKMIEMCRAKLKFMTERRFLDFQ
jgi:hypothetical protein